MIVAGYNGFMLDVHVSDRTYARYIGRLAFVWVSVYSVIVGLKIVLWGWQIDKNGSCWVKDDQRKTKGVTS